MAAALLTRDALRRVLQSLITATRHGQAPGLELPRGLWMDDLLLGETAGAAPGCDSLGCDSLDLLQTATAVNEMFHLHEAHLDTELLHRATFGSWLDLVQQAWAEGVAQITVTTSGSSGHPKACTHLFTTLQLEVEYLASLFSETARVVAFTPAHHVYGLLFTAMLPDRLGVPVQDLLQSASSGEPAFRPGLHSGDLIVSFPEGWRWILQMLRPLSRGISGVVSTAPCPPELIASLMDAGLEHFTEVYGSSETAGIGTREWPSPAYTLMPQWRRLPSTPSGELTHVFGFQAALMDHLDFQDATTFTLAGRKDQGTQVGGVNVFPGVIAERLQAHAGVAAAAVRPMRTDEGYRLKCFIVPAPGIAIAGLETELRSWVNTWPVAAERPKRFDFGAALPTGALGKAADW